MEKSINYFNIWQTGYESNFNDEAKMSQRSLSLTQSVLDERKKLFFSIDALNLKIHEGISKMNDIEQECRVMEQNKTLIKANKNFTYNVVETVCKEEKLKPGTYVTNCVKCNMTCHDNCCTPDDADKAGCWIIKNNRYCRICGCHWN